MPQPRELRRGRIAAADDDIEQLWRSVLPDQGSAVQVRTEVVEGLAARVLLDRCAGRTCWFSVRPATCRALPARPAR